MLAPEGEHDGFSVEASVEEYPEGAHNGTEFETDNCKVTSDNLDISFSD